MCVDICSDGDDIKISESYCKQGDRMCPFVSQEELFPVGCLISRLHTSVSQGRICSDSRSYCHTEMEVAGQLCYLTQSQYTDNRPTSPASVPPGAV